MAVFEQSPEQPSSNVERAQWLRAGMVSTASLMMGVAAVNEDAKAMIISGFAVLVAWACSMVMDKFVSVYSQLDIEVAQMKREKKNKDVSSKSEEGEGGEVQLPSPVQAAAASVLAFSVGAMVPLLAAVFIKHYKVRLGVVAAAATVALTVFGWLGAKLGKAPMGRSCLRVLEGGWLAMLATFGIMKLFGTHEL